MVQRLKELSEATGCKYVNPTDADFNRAIEKEGGKELSMANQKDEHKKLQHLKTRCLLESKLLVQLF